MDPRAYLIYALLLAFVVGVYAYLGSSAREARYRRRVTRRAVRRTMRARRQVARGQQRLGDADTVMIARVTAP